MSPEPNSAKLTDGSEWVDHEDCIVGDAQGLRNLMSACEVALQKGEYYGGDLGDYVGVKRMDTEWFAAPADSKSTRVGNAILGVVLLVIGGLTLLGFGTAISFLLGAMA